VVAFEEQLVMALDLQLAEEWVVALLDLVQKFVLLQVRYKAKEQGSAPK
jgi:hypothetical protein